MNKYPDKFKVHGHDAFWKSVEDEKWEPETFEMLNKYLNKRHSYLDIGAWIGPTVLFAANRAKEVYAFEPDPVAYQELRQNLELNLQLGNIVTFEKAVTYHGQNIHLGARREFGDSMTSVLWSKDKIEVESTGFNRILSLVNDCNFIKVDIEGGEKDLFKGNALESYGKPTLLLSLHAPFFEDKEAYFNDINEVLKIYKNIYNMQGVKITLHDVRKMDSYFTSVVASEL